MKRLILVRHGSTSWNTDGRLNSFTDIELSDEGAREVEMLARGFPVDEIDAVYCSPLRRTLQTAKIILQSSNLSYQIDERLRELNFGPFEGKSQNMLFGAEVDLFNRWRSETEPITPSGCETLASAVARTGEFLDDRLVDNATVLAVTHGVIARILLCAHVLGRCASQYRRLRLDNASVAEVFFEEDISRLVKLN